jgi:hypothetical protein
LLLAVQVAIDRSEATVCPLYEIEAEKIGSLIFLGKKSGGLKLRITTIVVESPFFPINHELLPY